MISRRFFGFKNTLIILVISFSILTYFAKLYDYFPVDLVVTQTVQSFHFFWLDQLMWFISLLGNGLWAPLMAAFFAGIAWLIQRRRDGVMILLAGLGSIILSQFLKHLIARPRPDSSLIVYQVDNYIKPDSFPSGHVIYFVGLYGFLLFLAYIHLKNKWYRYFLALFYSIPITLGGISRIYLGAHWLSDVLGAYLIGSIWLLLLIYLYQRIIAKD